MSIRMSSKSLYVDLRKDFSAGLGSSEFKKIHSCLWVSLSEWLNSLSSEEHNVISKYYSKIKLFSKNDTYLEKSLKMYYLFKVRLERSINEDKEIENICFNLYISTSGLSKHKSSELVVNNLYKCSTCIDPAQVHKINDWDQKYFSNPKQFLTPFHSDKFQFLIHPVPYVYYGRKEYVNAEYYFKQNESISINLISDAHRYFSERFSLILSVPKQNFMSTKNLNLPLNSFQTPKEIIQNSLLSKTEIIACGRPSVHVHPRFPSTGEIKVIGGVIAVDKYSTVSNEELSKVEKFANQIKYKMNIPIIKLDGHIEGNQIAN